MDTLTTIEIVLLVIAFIIFALATIRRQRLTEERIAQLENAYGRLFAKVHRKDTKVGETFEAGAVKFPDQSFLCGEDHIDATTFQKHAFPRFGDKEQK
jgi:hypothetical protein